MAPFPKAKSSSAARPNIAADSAPELSLRRLRDGDLRAFETVFYDYYEALYNFAYQYVHSRETAEELVQDVLCRLWERRATLSASTREDGIDLVRAYLFRSVRNAAVSWIRHQRVERRMSEGAAPDVKPPGMGSGPPRADAAVQTEEVHTLLRRAVAALPEPYRQVLALRSEHHLSYTEIAAVLRLPLKTVESRVTRAFRTLREVLEGLR